MYKHIYFNKFFVVSVVAVFSQLASAATLSVCKTAGCNFSEIQPAVDAANNNDKIEIGAGNFLGGISIIDKKITLTGRGKKRTLIQGGYTVVAAHCSAGLSLKIVGVSIQGGSHSGLSNEGCDLTLQNSTVTNNGTHGNGGGIFNSGNISLLDCDISNNLGRVGGGGLQNDINANALIKNSRFTDNTAGIVGGGAISNSGKITIEAGSFSNNTAKLGGALYNEGTATLQNGTITKNSARLFGGGIYNSGSLKIQASRITQNLAESSGGGLANNAGTVTIKNTVIKQNSPDNCTGVNFDCR